MNPGVAYNVLQRVQESAFLLSALEKASLLFGLATLPSNDAPQSHHHLPIEFASSTSICLISHSRVLIARFERRNFICVALMLSSITRGAFCLLERGNLLG